MIRNDDNFRSNRGEDKLLLLHFLLRAEHIRVLPARPLAVVGAGRVQADGRGGPRRQLRGQPRGRGGGARRWGSRLCADIR